MAFLIFPKMFYIFYCQCLTLGIELFLAPEIAGGASK